MNFKIDNLQYCNWSREIFEINREAKLDAVHATIVYHEDFDELKIVLKQWDQHFKENSDLIFLGNDFKDIEKAKKDNKTVIFFSTPTRETSLFFLRPTICFETYFFRSLKIRFVLSCLSKFLKFIK